MVNNAERLDPYGDDPASERLRTLREGLRPSALDEGEAWRRRKDGALAVLRIEAFAVSTGPLRAAWSDDAEACLDAVWRQRWRERDREPGWIEARWRAPADRPDALRPASPVESPATPAVDWLSVDDHTGVEEADDVVAYEHVSVWDGRWLATLVVRHGHSDPVDAEVAAATVALWRRLADVSRRSDLARGSA